MIQCMGHCIFQNCQVHFQGVAVVADKIKNEGGRSYLKDCLTDCLDSLMKDKPKSCFSLKKKGYYCN